MWPLGTLITKKVLQLFLIVQIWMEKSSLQIAFKSHWNVTPAWQTFVRNMPAFNCVHHLNPYLFMSLALKRTMSCIDMNFEAMWFALKVGEQNKGPLNWLLM